MNIFQRIILVFSLPSLCMAGGAVVGNGGSIVTCENESASQHNQAVDLYELDHKYGFTHQYKADEHTPQKQIIDEILYKTMKLNASFSAFISIEVITFEQDSKMIDADFAFSNDISTPPPEGCGYETVIYQKLTQPSFIISPKFTQLTTLNKVALIFHEAIYNYTLNNQPVLLSSDKIRKLTAYLFSKEFKNAKDATQLNELVLGVD